MDGIYPATEALSKDVCPLSSPCARDELRKTMSMTRAFFREMSKLGMINELIQDGGFLLARAVPFCG